MSTTDFNTGQFNWKLYGSNLQSNSGQNLTLESSGNSNLILRTNGVTRLTINSSGAWSWQGGMSYNNVSNSLTATTFIGDLSGNAQNISGGSGGQLLYQSSANVTDKLANGTAGYYLVANGGTTAPSWFNNKLYYYDEMWAEGANVNGLLGFILGGSGAAPTITNGIAEVTRFGIVRVQTDNTNTSASWTMRMPLLWSNISYFEIGFRGWPINTSTNTTLNIGLMDSRTSSVANGVYIQYSTNQSPTNIWNVRLNGVTNAFSPPLSTQLVGTWLKVRITNTSDISGSWSVTFTNQITGDTQTLTGSGLTLATQYYIGGLITCVSGGVVKVFDMDYCELQLK
jgi:hypothetical protein